jgi:hypothetical protein
MRIFYICNKYRRESESLDGNWGTSVSDPDPVLFAPWIRDKFFPDPG